MGTHDKKWMIYGANGYTGRLIVEEAVSKGERPVLAGRNSYEIEKMAAQYGLSYRVFTLDQPEEVLAQMKDLDLVVLAAGPYSKTSHPIIAACLKTKTHYLDITGEVAVFENCKRMHEQAMIAGIMLLPGVGFTVVGADCLSQKLKSHLPDAISLDLCLFSEGKPSIGTIKTALESLPSGGRIIENGKLKKVPVDYNASPMPFKDKKRWGIAVPTAHIIAAFYSTGIPNITASLAIEKYLLDLTRFFSPFTFLLENSKIQQFISKQIELVFRNQSRKELDEGKSMLWGEVKNVSGESVKGTLDTLEAYKFTAISTVAIVGKVMKGKVITGFTTPSRLLGSDFVLSIGNTKMEIEN